MAANTARLGPRDEFEAARKKSQASTPAGSYLFEDMPTLRVVHYSRCTIRR